MSTTTQSRPAITPEMLVEEYTNYKRHRLSGRSLATANWVTTLAHPCRAYSVYMRTVPPEQRRQLKDSLGMIFSEGDDQERAVKRDLMDMGWDVQGGQAQMSWGKYQITGRQDMKLCKPGFDGVYVDVKSCSPYTFAKINYADDVWNHPFHFIQKWANQLSLYMVLRSVERYWMLMKDKTSGRIKVVEFTLGDRELQAAEGMLQKATETNAFVANEEAPTAEMKIGDPDICAECEFFTACMPELNFGIAAKILTDELASDLAVKTESHEELKPLAKEYDELHEELTTEVKGLCADGQDSVVYGDFVANVKRIPMKPQPAKTVPAKEGYTQQRISFVKVVSKV